MAQHLEEDMIFIFQIMLIHQVLLIPTLVLLTNHHLGIVMVALKQNLFWLESTSFFQLK